MPPLSVYKANCDAAWSKDSHCMSLGMVLRDDQGSLIMGANASGFAATPL